jgi:molybdopterin molybdotransferase
VADLLSLDEAIAIVLERVRPLPSEHVLLASALGRVTAEAATAAVDLPPFPSSAMDGFAIRSPDVPATLPVVERIAAGHPARQPLSEGEAMAIATGGVVPDGADAVVPIEHVVQQDNRVEIPNAVASGANVRPRGGDVHAGEPVVPVGTRLAPSHIGALAAAGVAEVTCARRPVSAVVATGSELREPGQPLEPGQIYESNSGLISAALVTAGAEVASVVTVSDDERLHREALENALAHDVVITSGGVSVGPHDLVREVERELGVEEVFWRVAVKPGKPVSFGTRGDTLVFGLPGNPVSVLVGFELFVRPALRALEGDPDPGPRWQEGRLARAVRRNDARDELVRARRTPDGFEPLAGQESHMIVRSASADVLVLVPRGAGELAAGEDVRWLPLA